jgi:hypothetical protein
VLTRFTPCRSNKSRNRRRGSLQMRCRTVIGPGAVGRSVTYGMLLTCSESARNNTNQTHIARDGHRQFTSGHSVNTARSIKVKAQNFLNLALISLPHSYPAFLILKKKKITRSSGKNAYVPLIRHGPQRKRKN